MTTTSRNNTLTEPQQFSRGLAAPKALFLPQDFVQHHQVNNGEKGNGPFDYSINKRIGKGGYGTVYSCRHKQTGVKRAMKVMAKKKRAVLPSAPPCQTVTTSSDEKYGTIDETSPTCIDGEVSPITTDGTNQRESTQQISLLEDNCSRQSCSRETSEFYHTKKIDHPNSVAVYQCLEDSQNVYMIMDHFNGGDLFHVLTENLGSLRESNAATVLNSILTTINHMHTHQHMVHLDLKLENVMFATEDLKMKDVKIVDFGLARKIEYKEDGSVSRFTKVVGSTHYMSPQNFLASYDPCKQDIWSIGVLTWMILAECPPFEGDTDFQIKRKIMGHEMNEHKMFDAEPAFWATISDEAKDFIASLMSFDEDKRPTAAQALQHPWLRAAREKASLVMHKNFQDNAIFCHDVQWVFESLLQSVTTTETSSLECPASMLWKEITVALLVAQYGVTGAKREVINDCFRELDVTCEGILRKEGFLLGLQRFYPLGNQDSEALESIWQSLVSRCDTDFLTFTDFVKAVSSEQLLKDEDRLLFAWSFLSQGSDFITPHSLRDVLVRLPHRFEFDLGIVIREMMKVRQFNIMDDGPGRISLSEFKALVQPRAPSEQKALAFSRCVSTDSEEADLDIMSLYSSSSSISWLESCLQGTTTGASTTSTDSSSNQHDRKRELECEEEDSREGKAKRPCCDTGSIESNGSDYTTGTESSGSYSTVGGMLETFPVWYYI